MSTEMEYWDNFTHYLLLAIGIALIVTASIVMTRVIAAKLPFTGLQQLLAAA